MDIEKSQEQQSQKPNIGELMQSIRKELLRDQGARVKKPAFDFQTANPSSGQRKAGELLNSEELRYLNQHYNFGPNLDLNSISSHRPGIIGKLIVKFKQKLLSIIWDLLKFYFAAEREFHANLVRYLNDVSKYVDARDASNFWEVIRKIDVDVTRALERIERINDEFMASQRSSERRVYEALDDSLHSLRQGLAELKSCSVQDASRLGTLESVASGLEHIVSGLGKRQLPPTATAAGDNVQIPDYSYLLLENRFRGSEVEISKRMEIYPALFKEAKQPILEIGAGRGELLELFKQQSIPAYAVDIDQAMVETTVAKGLDARLGDGIAHLRSLKEDSLGGVIACQVVEHLTRQQLEELIELCAAKVSAGGRVVFETINPRSLLALSSNYFRDPTHVWPLHPDTLAYAMELAGFVIDEVRYLSPVSQEAQLAELPVEEYMTPRMSYAISVINRNFKQLNDLIYGFQDYCIVARVK